MKTNTKKMIDATRTLKGKAPKEPKAPPPSPEGKIKPGEEKRTVLKRDQELHACDEDGKVQTIKLPKGAKVTAGMKDELGWKEFYIFVDQDGVRYSHSRYDLKHPICILGQCSNPDPGTKVIVDGTLEGILVGRVTAMPGPVSKMYRVWIPSLKMDLFRYTIQVPPQVFEQWAPGSW